MEIPPEHNRRYSRKGSGKELRLSVRRKKNRGGERLLAWRYNKMAMKDDKNSELIAAIKQFPMLYDIWHPDFKNALLKLSKWKEVAEMCNYKSETIVQNKWKHLRDYYKKLVREEEKNPSTPSRPSWPYKEQLEFLRESVSSKNDVGSDVSDVEGTVAKSSDLDSLLSDFLKRKQAQKQPKDSLTKFFEYVESSVRALSVNRQLSAKGKIYEILMRFEEEELEEKKHGHTNVLPSRNTQNSSMNFPHQAQNPPAAIPNARFIQQHPQTSILNQFTTL